MWATRVIGVAVAVLAVPINILAFVTTLVSGIIAAIPLVNIVYILTLSLVWQFFLWPLVGAAWLWSRLPRALSWPMAVVCIPLAILGDTLLKLTGAVSPDPEDRIGHLVKQALCQQWPYAHVSDETGESLIQAIQRERQSGFVSAVGDFGELAVRSHFNAV